MLGIAAIVDHVAERPGPGWHAHGVTTKHLWILHGWELRLIRLRKQRWREVTTGRTCHDRPVWDRPGSPYGLDVVFTVLGLWLLGSLGLQRVDYPWADDRPCRRTVHRWYLQLLPEADAWHHAIRLAFIDLAAPRPLEEKLPTGGIPPPGARFRRHQDTAAALRLRSSAWLLKTAAHSLSMPVRTLLVEARRRWSRQLPTTG